MAESGTAGRVAPLRTGFRPSPRLLGLHAITGGLLAIQLLMLAFNFIAFERSGLSLAWTRAYSDLGAVLALLALWGYFVAYPGRSQNDWVWAETFLALALFLMLALQAGPGQYAAASLKRPLIDGWLASADSAIGIHVPSLTEWTRRYPLLAHYLVRAYFTLLPQFFLPFFVLGFLYRDRESLWEYLFHFHVASLVTLFCFAVWPAASAFTFYGFDSVIDQTRFIRHFTELRTGQMTVVTMGDIEGLVSFPSFHAAGALIVTWAFRRTRVWLAGLVLLNLALIAATVMTGAHYLIDVIASFLLLAASVFLYRRLAGWIVPSPQTGSGAGGLP